MSFSKSIFIINEKELNKLLNDNEYDTFHICNTYTGDWKHNIANYLFYNHNKINHKNYFCDTNPIYNSLNIEDKYLYYPNVSLPLSTIEINSIIYYKMVGLNNTVRMNFFNYYRDIEKENYTKTYILNKYSIKEGVKYNIINTIGSQGDFIDINRIKCKIQNNYPCIDINLLVDFPGWLFRLIEDAEELHLVEGFNVNFIYYCQYNNIINIKSPVYFHIWARNRNWIEYKLDNWIYVFNEY